MTRFSNNPNGKGIKTGFDALMAFMAECGDATEVEACRAFLASNPEYVKELRKDHLSVQHPEN